MSGLKRIQDVADRYAELATTLQNEGFDAEADYGFKAAAMIDLADESLQACWGGPFNGQKARQDLIQDIIKIWKPEMIVETGTFRGITTEWLAQNTSTPIITCEKNKRFFFQSEQKLSKYSNVQIFLQDSRDLLRKIGKSDVSEKRVIFYLDAHWEFDLPLREEILIIITHFKFPCIIIDDFKVPFDAGYFYDDYGPGKVLSLELLEGVIGPNTLIAFPATPSELETGARRGTVILIPNEMISDFRQNNLLRLADYRDWRLMEIEKNFQGTVESLQGTVESLSRQLIESDADRNDRLQIIEDLSHRLAESDADRNDRLQIIEDLSHQLSNYNLLSRVIEKVYVRIKTNRKGLK